MNLKKLRQDRKKTQDEIAKILSLQKQTYQNYELGKRKPDLEILCKLADYYQVSMDYVVERNFEHEITTQDRELLNIVEQLSPLTKAKVIGYAKARLEEEKETKERQLIKNLKGNK